jgi:hypothetical protein
MEKHLEHEASLPVIVASHHGHGLKQVCVHCKNEIVTLNPIEGDAVCERCHALLTDLVAASRQHGFHFGS